ncbi:MAG: hypothetical protein M1836_001154 [Candelina mexicana]|nr:MAG: hypothetical protein M1836_001154 [Candelina mexicana]
MAAAVISTAGLAMIQDSVGSAKLGQALGIVFSISTIGELVGPGLGGMLYDAAGIHAVYGVAVGFIAVDLIMRLLAVDSKTAATTRNNISHSDGRSDQENVETRLGTGEVEPCEDSPLLHKSNDNNDYKINAKLGGFVQAVPVLYCFRDPRLVMAQFLGIVQGSILGLFEATVPTEAAALFQFSSFKAGLLFTTITIPYIFLGPLAGRAVDRYGTKLVATTGYVFLIPCLAILGLPSQKLITGTGNIVLFCAILLLNGAGLSAIGSPSFVEAIDVTGNYEAANPGFFGEKGPYAQMFGFNFVFFFSGLTIGPLLGGALRNAFGYAVMGYVFAALSTITAILSYFFVGPRGTREE